MTEIVQLAHTYEGRVFDNGVFSRKFDGKRMYICDGVGYSRTAKVCRPAPIKHIVDEISTLPIFKDFIPDGEVLYFEKNFKDNFKKAISLTSRIARGPECDGLYYVIFDIIPKECFVNQLVKTPFDTEYYGLLGLLNAKPIKGRPDLFSTCLPHVLVARQVSDPKEFAECKDFNKWEGLMYRNAKAPYEFKRSYNLLKVKEWQDTECKIIGFKAGIGKHLGRLGAILVDYKGNEVAVGSGFTDQEREVIWASRHLILEKKLAIKIKYFEESCNATGQISLRFPTFICFRDNAYNDIILS